MLFWVAQHALPPPDPAPTTKGEKARKEAKAKLEMEKRLERPLHHALVYTTTNSFIGASQGPQGS